MNVVGIYANNEIFPIAYGVLEIEDTKTWSWFLEIFFRIVNGNGCVFITDKQKGLGKAIENLMPASEHRHCVRLAVGEGQF